MFWLCLVVVSVAGPDHLTANRSLNSPRGVPTTFAGLSSSFAFLGIDYAPKLATAASQPLSSA